MLNHMIPPGGSYVAMGSSYAAGPGILPVEHWGAMRSGRNYPHQVAQALSLRLTDVTCSGATTSNIPWVTGLRFGIPCTGGPVPYHPTLAGMSAVARLVIDHLYSADS